jgi:hypothetical protein
MNQEPSLVFHFRRLSSARREVTVNGCPWLVLGPTSNERGIDLDADWGPESTSSDLIAAELIDRVFEPDVPSYGRIRGWPAMNRDYRHAVALSLLASESHSEFVITSAQIIALAPSEYSVAALLERPKWPSPGEKLRFSAAGSSSIADPPEYARKLLIPSNIYTLASIECASSSTKVTLAETGDAEFNYIWFERL